MVKLLNTLSVQVITKKHNKKNRGLQNFKTANIKITKHASFHSFIYAFIFLFYEMKLYNLRNLLFFYLENEKVSEIKKFIKFGIIIKYFQCSRNLKKNN